MYLFMLYKKVLWRSGREMVTLKGILILILYDLSYEREGKHKRKSTMRYVFLFYLLFQSYSLFSYTKYSAHKNVIYIHKSNTK